MAATQSNGLNRGVNDPAMHSDTDSEHIRRDIDRTRGEMDRTIDELGARLHPRNLFDDLVCSVRDSFFGRQPASSTSSREAAGQASESAARLARSVGEAIRENPVPAALMGAGLAWLMFEDKAERQYRRMRHDYNQRGYSGDRWRDPGTHSGSYVDARTGEPYDESYGAGYEDRDFDGEPDTRPKTLKDRASGAAHAVGSAAHAVGDAASRAASSAKNVASKTGEAASSAGRSVRHAGSRAGEFGRTASGRVRGAGSSMRRYSHDVGESARHYGHVASDRLAQGYDVTCERFDRALNEKPLAVGVAALAAGLLAGFVLPHTRTEDRMYGSSSDRLKDEARRRAREAAEQGKEVASHVAESALGDAEAQGLTPGSLGDKVSRVAKDALRAAKDSAEREGIDPHSLGEKARHVGQTVKESSKSEVGSKSSSDGKLSATSSKGSTTVGSNLDPIRRTEAGGLSDDMTSVKRESEMKHDVAEGMTKSGEKSESPKI